MKRIQHILFRVPEKTLSLFLNGLFGLAAGLSSVAFLLTTNGIFKYTYLAWMMQ